jgi:hypothetical protein
VGAGGVRPARRDAGGALVGRPVVVTLDVLTLVAVVVGVDVVLFGNHFWERLMADVGIVLVFAAFGLKSLRRGRTALPPAFNRDNPADPTVLEGTSAAAQPLAHAKPAS